MKDSSTEFNQYGQNPIIIAPNIGKPTFLSKIYTENSEVEFSIDIYISARQNHNFSNIQQSLANHIFLLPLLDMDKENKRLIRGDPIILSLLSIKEIDSLIINNNSLRELYNLDKKRISYLIWHDFFGKDQKLFEIKCSFSLNDSQQSIEWLNSHPFLMFDLYQNFSSLDLKINRICYHSVVLRAKSFDQLFFTHITDLHIAKRFDEILAQLIKPRSKILKKFVPHIHKEIPLEDRYNNPNNFFRRFITWANEKNKEHSIDFIIATGDLIDYYLKNDQKKMKSYEMEESNWDVFLDILLNRTNPLNTKNERIGIFPPEELSVPIFTCTGNHDVRVHGYPLFAATNIYRNFGLKRSETRKYRDPFKKSQWKALIIDKYCLKPYYRYINPFDDYFCSFGHHNFLFLNSGADSFLDFKSLLMADPSAVGFSKKQIKFAQNSANLIMNNHDSPESNFLISHAPVLNPQVKNILLRSFLKIIRLKKYKKAEMYKGKKSIRKLDFKYGTINNNWLDTLSLMYSYKMNGLMGHTHQLREIKYFFSGKSYEYDPKTKEIKNNPFLMHWDDFTYKEKYDIKYFNSNIPFVLQTPSLGIGRYKSGTSPGIFRYFCLEKGEIQSVELKQIKK